MADTVRSEDVLGEKWDRCLTDGAIKLGKDVLLAFQDNLITFPQIYFQKFSEVLRKQTFLEIYTSFSF